MAKCFHIRKYRGYLFSWEDLKGCQSHTNVNTRSMLITKAWITCKFHLTQLNWKTGPSALPLCCGLQMSLLLTFIINKYLQLELQWWQNGSSNLITGTPWVTIFIKLTIPPKWSFKCSTLQSSSQIFHYKWRKASCAIIFGSNKNPTLRNLFYHHH